MNHCLKHLVLVFLALVTAGCTLPKVGVQTEYSDKLLAKATEVASRSSVSSDSARVVTIKASEWSGPFLCWDLQQTHKFLCNGSGCLPNEAYTPLDPDSKIHRLLEPFTLPDGRKVFFADFAGEKEFVDGWEMTKRRAIWCEENEDGDDECFVLAAFRSMTWSPKQTLVVATTATAVYGTLTALSDGGGGVAAAVMGNNGPGGPPGGPGGVGEKEKESSSSYALLFNYTD